MSKNGYFEDRELSEEIGPEKRFWLNGKRLVKKALVQSRLLSIASRLARAGVVVLNYHSIQDHPDASRDIFVSGIVHSTSLFERQMALLASRYNPIDMEDVWRFLNGHTKLPRRPVAITFDDGFADNCEIAAPILNRFGIRALFNVTVGFIESPTPPWFCRLRRAFAQTKVTTWRDSTDGRNWNLAEPTERRGAFLATSIVCAKDPADERENILSSLEKQLGLDPLPPEACPMMTWQQLRSLRDSGHLIGSHTLSHPNVAYVDEQRQWEEISQSKFQLESKLGSKVDFFSYPNPILRPNFNDRTMELTQKAGYKLAVVSLRGIVRADHNGMAVHRIPVPSTLSEFVWSLENTRLGRQI
jgi:peptidoglycan/xylan/chitin deacetylase (PgdA/CDA1 family)